MPVWCQLDRRALAIPPEHPLALKPRRPDSCECAITGALVKHRCPCDYALQLSGSGLNGSGLRTVLGPPTRLPLARLVPASERAGCSTGGPVRVKFEAAGEKGEVHEDRRRR